MLHEHNIIDNDVHFIISDTGEINLLSDNKDSIIYIQQFLHLSESFTFEAPRYIEGHDMSLSNIVNIHFTNIDSKTKEESKDIYPVDGLKVDEQDENKIIFTCKLKDTCTRYVGLLKFSIIFECYEDDVVIYRWPTDIFSKIMIRRTNYNSGSIVIEHSDIISEIQNDIKNIKSELNIVGDISKEKISEAVNEYLTANPIEETDPTVPNWAKQAEKPSYTASEVGALPNTTIIPTTLPNPNALTFTGAATGSYDGSSPVEINIPEGGGTDVAVDTTLSVAGHAADAKATGEKISELKGEIANLNIDEEQIKNVVVTWLDEHPEATTTVQDGSITLDKLNNEVIDLIAGGSVPSKMPTTTWYDEWQYGIGDNTLNAYQCWMANNLQYDKLRNRFVFVQCHRANHTGAFTKTTMHIINPSDILTREDIEIPTINGIANFLIIGDKYYLYPKTTSAIRYVSSDGGTTWTSEELNTHLQHMFGVYYCNGAFYGGCDYEWDEYHYSVDGINWETKNFGYVDSNGNHTKEHSFVYWKGYVYAFGRRDFYKNDDSSQGLLENPSNCAVILKLNGDTWSAINDDSILAFQSNTHAIPFNDKIVLVSINRLSASASLNFYEFDGKTVTLLKQWSDLTIDGTEGSFTTPCIAYGDGYTIIGYSGAGGGLQKSCNMALVGTYDSNKSVVSSYGSIKTQATGHIGNDLKDGKLSILPSEDLENISVSPSNSLAIQNDIDHDILVMRNYFSYCDYGNANAYFVMNNKLGKIDTNALNWGGKVPLTYKNRAYFVPYRTNIVYKPMIIDGIFTEKETDIDISSLKDGNGVYYLASGSTLNANGLTLAYFELATSNVEEAEYVTFEEAQNLINEAINSITNGDEVSY